MYRNNQLHKIRVLITDDHTLFREGIKSLLERDGDIECISIVPDGEQAVRLSKELLPSI